MANTNTNRQFLDYTGLETLWGIIKTNFATKSTALNVISIDKSADGKIQYITGKMADGTTTLSPVELPMASESQSGLMSIDYYNTVRDLKVNVDKYAPFAGLQLHNNDTNENNEVSLTGRKAAIALKYEPERTATGVKAYISLVDPNYPSTGRWAEISKDIYDANYESNIKNYIKVGTDESAKYYIWTLSPDGTEQDKLIVADSVGPVNALNEPLLNQPISRIDVSEFIKTGLLREASVVIDPENQTAGTYIKLVFNTTTESGEDTTTTQYINVSDLVDIYTEGDGISITATNAGIDETARGLTIAVTAATDSTFGGIKTGYSAAAGTIKTYAVELTDDGKAYVAVPWNETVVNAGTPADNKYGNDSYLTVSSNPTSETLTDGSIKTTYAISVAANKGLTDAVDLAHSSIQSVDIKKTYADGDTQTPAADYLVIDTVDIPTDTTGIIDGKNVTVDLTTSAKESLALADSAVQGISTTNLNSTDRPNADGENDIIVTPSDNAEQKGQKSYKIALGDRTKGSLNLADTALQEITLFGNKLEKGGLTEITSERAKQSLGLGTAAELNSTTDITLVEQTSEVTIYDGTENKQSTVTRNTVPTTLAVKTYVDNTADDITEAYTKLIGTSIAGLDSDLTIGDNETDFIDNTHYGVTENGVTRYPKATKVFNKITIADGKLDTYSTRELSIYDITDFAPLSDSTIQSICTFN